MFPSLRSGNTIVLDLPRITDRRISLNEVDAKFTGEVDQLRSTLVRLVQEPHRFGGKSIYGGPTLESLLIDVCKAVNEGSKHISPMRYAQYQCRVQDVCR